MSMRAITMALVLLMLAGCASLPIQILPEDWGDAVIATKIKSRLIDAPELAAAAIHVEADRGIVTLTGFVESNPQRRQAEAMARTIPGVRPVNNRREVQW